MLFLVGIIPCNFLEMVLPLGGQLPLVLVSEYQARGVTKYFSNKSTMASGVRSFSKTTY